MRRATFVIGLAEGITLGVGVVEITRGHWWALALIGLAVAMLLRGEILVLITDRSMRRQRNVDPRYLTGMARFRAMPDFKLWWAAHPGACGRDAGDPRYPCTRDKDHNGPCYSADEYEERWPHLRVTREAEEAEGRDA